MSVTSNFGAKPCFLRQAQLCPAFARSVQLFGASENFFFSKQSHFNSRSVAGTSKQVGQPREAQKIKSKINSNPTVEETQGILQREDSPVLRLIHHPVQPK